MLALRGRLYPLSDDPWWLVSVRALDGVGARLFGALMPMIVADLTRGAGHFGAGLGAIAAAQGLGFALSNGVTGWVVVVQAGHAAAFLAQAATAAAGALLFWRAMPATAAIAAAARPAPSPSPAR